MAEKPKKGSFPRLSTLDDDWPEEPLDVPIVESSRKTVAPPPSAAEALRKAFMDTMKDNEFLADAEKSQLEINPVDGAEVEKLVKELYQTPKPLADKAAQFIRH